jgi:hypothetical protein
VAVTDLSMECVGVLAAHIQHIVELSAVGCHARVMLWLPPLFARQADRGRPAGSKRDLFC